MKCLRCGYDSDTPAKFCPECGTQNLKFCAACSHGNPMEAHFCTNCGTQFVGSRPNVHTGVATSQRAAQDSSTLSEPSFQLSADGERRYATVLRTDLSGYTALTESLDPEQVQEILSRIKAIAARVIGGAGGLINQFRGDE